MGGREADTIGRGAAGCQYGGAPAPIPPAEGMVSGRTDADHLLRWDLMKGSFKVSDRGVDFAYLASGTGPSAPTAYFLSLSPMAPPGMRNTPARLMLRVADHSAMKRALVISDPGDRVFFPLLAADTKVVEDNIAFVTDLYERAAIPIGRLESYRGPPLASIKKVARDHAIATTIYSRPLNELLPMPGLSRAVERLNNKASAMEHLERCGVDVPAFFNMDRWRNRRTLREAVRGLGLPFFVKRVHGAGGNAVWRMDSFSHAELMRKRLRHGPLHLQAFMRGEESHNVLYLILPDEVRRLLVTYQRVTENWKHRGNDWPARMENPSYADQVADCCRQLGFVGVLGIDLKGKVLEINPRHNTSGVILGILGKVPGVEKVGTSWSHDTTALRISKLGLDDLWFRNGTGILPLTWSDRSGRMSFAFVNDFNGSVEAELRRRCPLQS